MKVVVDVEYKKHKYFFGNKKDKRSRRRWRQRTIIEQTRRMSTQGGITARACSSHQGVRSQDVRIVDCGYGCGYSMGCGFVDVRKAMIEWGRLRRPSTFLGRKGKKGRD